MRTETAIRNCYITARGIKKRCRKEDRHYLEMGTYPLETTAEMLEAKARELLAAEMKSVSKAVLHLDYAQEITETDSNWHSMVCELLDKRNIEHSLV